jgi:two-component system response regulator
MSTRLSTLAPELGAPERPTRRLAPLGRASGSKAPRAREGKWLLLVEDNAYDEALTLRAFNKHGLASSVVVAHDGVEALECLLGPDGDGESREGATDLGQLPRLILLDLNLPRMDGFEVLRRLSARPRTRLVPVVVLSSSLEREDLVRCYGLGANSYIRKPVDYAEFVVTAAQLGVYWLGLNQPPPRLETP